MACRGEGLENSIYNLLGWNRVQFVVTSIKFDHEETVGDPHWQTFQLVAKINLNFLELRFLF